MPKGPKELIKSKAKSKTAKGSKKPEQFKPSLEFETRSGYPQQIVVGVDEVGRGCLAGPVVAAAVALPLTFSGAGGPKLGQFWPEHSWILEVTDSKLLSAEKREDLALKISDWALGVSIASASVEEIDHHNIHHASHLAMVRALEGLKLKLGNNHSIGHVLVDGKFIPKQIDCSSTAIIKGDLRCLSIACASIIAKVWRDQQMVELDRVHPGYDLAVNKGYFTPKHKAALGKLGFCSIHRRSFAPVKELI